MWLGVNQCFAYSLSHVLLCLLSWSTVCLWTKALWKHFSKGHNSTSLEPSSFGFARIWMSAFTFLYTREIIQPLNLSDVTSQVRGPDEDKFYSMMIFFCSCIVKICLWFYIPFLPAPLEHGLAIITPVHVAWDHIGLLLFF